jgi:preprotein translocase subunit SecF
MFEILVGTRYQFMRRRKMAYAVSAILILVTIGALVARGGPRESIDFTGGSVLYVGFDTPVPVEEVRAAATGAPFDEAEIQIAEEGRQAIIHFRQAVGDTTNPFSALENRLEARRPGVGARLLSLDVVGPKVGRELEQKATLAVLVSLALMLVYIAFRFTRVSFGLAALIALFHTVFVVLGVFTILNLEVSLTIVAAFLTLSGYAINDSIVVFDRIRENMGLTRRMSFADVVDKSINETLSRTILTGGTTFVSVCGLYFLGGSVIRDFAFAMGVGMVVGTYSTVFVASALAVDFSNWWTGFRAKRTGHPSTPKAAAHS